MLGGNPIQPSTVLRASVTLKGLSPPGELGSIPWKSNRTCDCAAFARCHDWALAPLSRDEAGLTILAYALGVALIVVPIALAVALFGTNVVSGAD